MTVTSFAGVRKGVRQSHQFLWEIGNRNANSQSATGTIPVFNIPANTLIHDVRVLVGAAVTGSTAEVLGDGNDLDGYLADGFASATGSPFVSDSYANKGAYSGSATTTFYSAADTIDFIPTGTMTAGKIRFFVEFTRME